MIRFYTYRLYALTDWWIWIDMLSCLPPLIDVLGAGYHFELQSDPEIERLGGGG